MDETLTPQAQMTFIGVVRDLGPKVSEIPARKLSPEERRQLQRGTIYWAGEGFLRPGLYVWTGEASVLIESRENILVKMEAAVRDPNAPQEEE